MFIVNLLLAVAGVCAVFGVMTYNRLVALARRCDQSAADIDVQLKQRHDLVPNLVETVKGYATHERGTLDDVIKARGAALSASTPEAQAQAEARLGSALGRLMAVAESYPDLKASANFSALQDELSDLENKIAAARRFLNSAVAEFNTTREQFPANLFAESFGFKARDEVAVPKSAKAEIEVAPAVKF